MKQTFLIILSFFMTSGSVLAQECGIIPGFPADLSGLFESKCLDVGKRRTCNCLREEKNALIAAAFKSNDLNVEKKLAENKAKYTNRFMSVYSQMTVESSAQMVIMGLADNGLAVKSNVGNTSGQKEVGCSPDQISSKVSERFESFKDSEGPALEKVLKKVQKQKEQCENPSGIRKLLYKVTTMACDQYDETINRIKVAQERLKDPKNASCSASLSVLQTQQKEIRNAIEYLTAQIDDAKTEDEKRSRKNEVERLKQVMKYFNGHASGMMVGAIVTLNQSGEAANAGPSMKSVPGMDSAQCLQDVQFAQTKLKQVGRELATLGGDAFKQEQCEREDTLCNSFAGKNAELEKAIKEKFTNDPHTSCLSFAEYKTFKSMPGQSLLDAFEDASDKKMRSLLHAPTSADDELKKAQTLFLRSNPIIAKLAATDNSILLELGGKLKKLAVDLKSITDSGRRLSTYLNFMKNDIGPMVKKSGDKTELYICDMMIDNFAAIQVANDVPSFKDAEDRQELFSKIEECKEKTYNKSVTTNLSASLKTSPIFTLGAEDKEIDDEAELDDYKNFKKDICANYENKMKSCKEADVESCRVAFLNDSEVGGRSRALTEHEIGRTITHVQMEKIANKTDVHSQDNGFKAVYEREVGSKLSHRFIARKGQENDFAHSQAADERIVSSTKLPERSYAPESSAPSSVASTPSSSPVNPSQDVPSFVNQPGPKSGTSAAAAPARSPASEGPLSFDAKEVQQAKTIQDVIPQYNQSTPENKVKYLDELKNFVASQPNQEELEDKFNLEEEKLQRLKEQKALAEAKIKQVADQTAVAKPLGPAPVFNSNSNVVGMYPTFPQPGSPASVSGSSFQARISAPAKGYGAVNDVLKEINAKKESGELQILIQSSVANSQGVARPYIVTDGNTLVAESESVYKELTAHPDKLAQFLAGKIDMSKLKDAELISVKDPASDHHMMFKVIKGKSNTLMFESWPTDVPVKVARSQRLDDLRMNLSK